MLTAEVSPTPHYRADIDGLRAVAILAVVGFHVFPSIAPGGFTGVDIFFVISGFLISRIIFSRLVSNQFSYLEFYSRRIQRLFPALAILLVFCLAVGWFVMLPKDYEQLGKTVVAGAAFFSNFLMWHEAGYFDQASVAKPLLHLWSLGIEEQFYLLYPVVLVVCWRARQATGWVIAALAVASFMFSIYLINTDPVAAFYSPFSRFWEFSVGGLIALQKNCLPRCSLFDNATVRECMSVAGISAILFSVIALSSESIFPGWWALLPVGGTAFLLWSGPNTRMSRYLLSNRILVWIGLISYPLYLWHWPLLTFARIGADEPLDRMARLAVIGTAVLFAWLTYRFVERPIRRGAGSTTHILALLLMVTAIGLSGLGVDLSKGLPSRMPDFIQKISSIEFDPTKQTRVGTCFLLFGQRLSDFNGCEDETTKSQKTILLLGDSHAAHLYPGLRLRFGHKLNIIQRTAAGCPPMFGMRTEAISDLCKDVNRYAQQYVKSNHPDVVILAANWLFYSPAELSDTILWLKAEGVEKVVVVGPVPQWRNSLLKNIYRHFRDTGEVEVPQRMALGLDGRVWDVDQEIAKVTTDTKSEYISSRALLCNSEGCLVRYGVSLETLITWDYGHLTNGASEYLVSKFPNIE